MSGSPCLTVRNLSKRFPGQVALDGVDLDVDEGEVHALIGANGSGKSTLIKCLAGYHTPEPGAEVAVGGEALQLGRPEHARHLGLRFIHQELALVDSLSIADNLALGPGYGQGRGWVSSRRASDLARPALTDVRVSAPPRTPVSTLSAVDRTKVALARALHGPWASPPRVVVMDEPTASLAHDEVVDLFATIREVVARGVSVLYVSHNMVEVLSLSDRVTVLRDGRVEQTRATAAVTGDDLVTSMVGAKLASLHVRPTPAPGPPLVRFRGVSGGPVRHLDLDVLGGEIVGLAGVDGSGRSEATYLLGGAVPWATGQLELDGAVHTRLAAHGARAAGVVFIGSDRARQSTIPSLSARENVTLGGLEECGRTWWVSRRAERRDATGWLERLGVSPPLPERLLGQFSGGNQQKIVLARAMRSKPKLLIVDQPVQGVDVGAKAAIFEQLLAAAADGLAIVVASSDAEDLAAICSRVVVLERGHVAEELVGDAITIEAIERSNLGRALSNAALHRHGAARP